MINDSLALMINDKYKKCLLVLFPRSFIIHNLSFIIHHCLEEALFGGGGQKKIHTA